MMRRSRLIKALTLMFNAAVRWTSWKSPAATLGTVRARRPGVAGSRPWDWLLLLALVVAAGWALRALWRVLAGPATWPELREVGFLGLLTLARVTVLIALASVLWVPVGVWIGLRPRVAQYAQPVAQFLAAFPANLLFPLVVYLVISWRLAPDIWLSPLMVLGTQWYILFNVIAGAAAMPAELRRAARNFHVHGWLWWRRVALPGIMPYYVTGAITASGGSWNAAIVAELASWGGQRVQARGLGAYIATATARGDFHRIALGIAAMCVFVVAINRLLWRPLYYYAERHFRLG